MLSDAQWAKGCYSISATEEEIMKKVLTAGLVMAGMMAASTSVCAAEPIVGNWKRTNGTILKYSSSGGTKYCGRVMTGEYKGKSIGCMSGTGGKYKGEVIKLDEGKTYTGKASATGSTMSLSGCVLGGMICKAEKLTRQ